MRSLLFIILVAIFTTGCASRLRVETEVYAGNDLITPKRFQTRVVEQARATREAVSKLDLSIAEASATEFEKAIAAITLLIPKAASGQPEDFRKSYRNAVNEQVLLPLQPEISRVLAKSEEVERLSLSGVPNEELRTLVTSLQGDIKKLIEGIQLRLDWVRELEQTQLLSLIHLHFDKGDHTEEEVRRTDDVLAKTTGLPVRNETERNAAIAYLNEQVQLANVDVLNSFGLILLAPIKETQAEITSILTVPLGDPNVPIVVGGADDKWRKWVNDVKSTSFFGNSETAFRMEGLGENHIKSIIFDPSEVTKIGLNVFSTTLRITAAAYGLPLPTNKTDDKPQQDIATQQALSKPLIDAEIGYIRSKQTIRGQRMETLFWKIADASEAFAGVPTNPASEEELKKISDLIECMAEEIEKPQTNKCGGSNE